MITSKLTYRDMVYMIFDELKITSDDSVWEPDHVIALLNKYRAMLIKQLYSHIRKDVPLAYYQDLNVSILDNKSTKQIPNILNLNGIELDSMPGKFNINLVSPERFKYVTLNKWLKNQIYITIDSTGTLYMKNATNFPVNNLTLTAILENPLEIIQVDPSAYKDPLDCVFPIEYAIQHSIVDLIIKELGSANYLPSDNKNNSTDDFDNMVVNTKEK